MSRIISLLAVLVLASASWPLVCFWRSARRTALRSTSCWAAATWAAWLLAAGLAGAEPRPVDWQWLGLLRLAATALVLAPLVAVLGARWPGELAWNLIVLTLLVVFALPVLEQSLLGKQLERDRLGIDGPRFVFFCLVAVVGIVNYVPTRFGPAVALFAAGLAAHLAAVGPWSIEAATATIFSSSAAILISASTWSAWLIRPTQARSVIEGAWLQLRDNWGLVWASRVRDRWNAVAARFGWPVRLGWRGLEPVSDQSGELRPLTEAELQEAETQLRLLLRRFLDAAPILKNGPHEHGSPPPVVEN